VCERVAGSPWLSCMIAGGAFVCRCGCAGVPWHPEVCGLYSFRGESVVEAFEVAGAGAPEGDVDPVGSR
jgi:hypothetical protein